MTTSNYRIPIVIEKSGREERAYDIYSRLLKDRIIFLAGGVDDEVANVIIAQMLFLSNEDRKAEIHFYINSPGGSVSAGLAVYDTMRFLRCDVATYCIGRAQSGGAIILASGTEGKRHILPHARVMIHQPYGGVYGQTTDVQIQAEEILKIKQQLNEILARHTGRTVEQIQEDSERDRYFSAVEAKEYGLVDEVLEQAPEENGKKD